MLLERFLNRIIKTGELVMTGPDGKAVRYGTPDPNRAPIHATIKDSATYAQSPAAQRLAQAKPGWTGA